MPGVKNQQLQGKSPVGKGRKPQSPRLSGAGLACPALEPARLTCALPDCARPFESDVHGILMSGEDLVSQKSLKYDHM